MRSRVDDSQYSMINGFSDRRLLAWMIFAARVLPDPSRPSINTVAELSATRARTPRQPTCGRAATDECLAVAEPLQHAMRPLVLDLQVAALRDQSQGRDHLIESERTDQEVDRPLAQRNGSAIQSIFCDNHDDAAVAVRLGQPTEEFDTRRIRQFLRHEDYIRCDLGDEFERLVARRGPAEPAGGIGQPLHELRGEPGRVLQQHDRAGNLGLALSSMCVQNAAHSPERSAFGGGWM